MNQIKKRFSFSEEPQHMGTDQENDLLLDELFGKLLFTIIEYDKINSFAYL